MKYYEPKSASVSFIAPDSSPRNSGVFYTVPAGRKAKLTYVCFDTNDISSSPTYWMRLKVNSTTTTSENSILMGQNKRDAVPVGTSASYPTDWNLIDYGIYLNAGDTLSLAEIMSPVSGKNYSVFVSLIEEYEA